MSSYFIYSNCALVNALACRNLRSTIALDFCFYLADRFAAAVLLAGLALVFADGATLRFTG